MAYLIGIDEAGYGPSLGPLVVAATVWETPEECLRDDPYRLWRKAVRKSPPARPGGRLWIADSKLVYRAGEGLEALERNVLAALTLAGCCPATWREAWQELGGGHDGDWEALPWHAGFDGPLPTVACGAAIARLAEQAAARLAGCGARLVSVRSRPVFPREWNELLERHGLKSEALSLVTLDLLAEVLAEIPPAAVLAVCDKHGGRNHYGPWLQRRFPDPLVEVYGEGRAASVYRFGPAEARIEVRFCARGESFLPTALASMVAKYLRELGMLAFNRFWCARLPELRPTAGYHNDARRFDREVAALRADLGIEDRVYWRAR